MIEAGAELQREAASNLKNTAYNVHQEGAIQQTPHVASTGQEAAENAPHDISTIQQIEHISANLQ